MKWIALAVLSYSKYMILHSKGSTRDLIAETEPLVHTFTISLKTMKYLVYSILSGTHSKGDAQGPVAETETTCHG